MRISEALSLGAIKLISKSGKQRLLAKRTKSGRSLLRVGRYTGSSNYKDTRPDDHPVLFGTAREWDKILCLISRNGMMSGLRAPLCF